MPDVFITMKEAAFWKAEADLAALDLILKLLEREARLERLLAGGRRIARARRFAADYLATLLASMAAVGLGFLAAAGFWIAADRVGPPGLLLALLAVGALAVTAWRNRK